MSKENGNALRDRPRLAVSHVEHRLLFCQLRCPNRPRNLSVAVAVSEKTVGDVYIISLRAFRFFRYGALPSRWTEAGMFYEGR